MRKLLSIFLILPVMSFAQDLPFSIEGKMKDLGFQPDWVYLQYRTATDWKTDSFQVKDGKYSFSGNVPEPSRGYLRVKYKTKDGQAITPRGSRDNATVFLEKATIKINSVDSFSHTEIKGSAAQNEYAKLLAASKTYDDVDKKLQDQYREYAKVKDQVNLSRIEEEMEANDKLRREHVYGEYVRKNPKSPIVLFALNQYAGWDIDADQVEPLFNNLSDADKKYPSAKLLAANIDIAKKTAIGKMAMDFTQNDTLDNPISLSSFRGKYVLVDFWASWCGPCRAENPNVVKAYQKLKDKNFHIIGVSLDRPGQKDRWIKAIHDDGLTWTQVSDLQFWNNAVAKQYGVQAIPQNILIGPDGKIVAKNLGGLELEQKMEELLGK